LLKTRVITAIFGGTLLVWLAFLGGAYFSMVIGVAVLLCVKEMGALMRIEHSGLLLWMYALALVPFLATHLIPDNAASVVQVWLAIGMLSSLLLVVLGYPRMAWNRVATGLWVVFYTSWTLWHLVLLRFQFASGFMLMMLVFLITWGSDTGAYFVGQKWGHRPLARHLSPKKTWEGAIGGVGLTIIMALWYNQIYLGMSNGVVLVLAFFGATAGIIGDLAESAIKRFAGVKDSGTLLPGHGGILDRFDSLMAVAPVVYYLLRLFIID